MYIDKGIVSDYTVCYLGLYRELFGIILDIPTIRMDIQIMHLVIQKAHCYALIKNISIYL